MKTVNRTLSALIVGLFFLCFQTRAQEPCLTMDALDQAIQLDPTLQSRMVQMERDIQQFVAQNQNSRGGVITIPVVVHVIHAGESIGNGTNISNAQVLSQIAVLNEDFRRQNSDAANTLSQFQSVAADVGIEFCMATRDPSGNATDGISRHNYNQSSYSMGTIDNTIKPQTTWDRNSYLNVWTVAFTANILDFWPSAQVDYWDMQHFPEDQLHMTVWS